MVGLQERFQQVKIRIFSLLYEIGSLFLKHPVFIQTKQVKNVLEILPQSYYFYSTHNLIVIYLF
jgi:hypothetical protein